MACQSRSGVIVHELTIAAAECRYHHGTMGMAYNEQLLQANSFLVFVGSCKYDHVKEWLMFLTQFLKNPLVVVLHVVVSLEWICMLGNDDLFACSAMMIHTGKKTHLD